MSDKTNELGSPAVAAPLTPDRPSVPATDTAERIRCLEIENQRLRDQLNTPELHDFAAGVVSEAQHQRERWGVEGDAGKTPADWFWLVGYLAGKALTAANASITEKALHHTISTAAALANWHAAMSGASNVMRPGTDQDAALTKAVG